MQVEAKIYYFSVAVWCSILNRPLLELNKWILVPTTFICVHPINYIKICFVKGLCYFSGTVCSLECGHNWLLKLASNRAGHHPGCFTPGLAVSRVLQKLGLNCVQERHRKSETPSPGQDEIVHAFWRTLVGQCCWPKWWRKASQTICKKRRWHTLSSLRAARLLFTNCRFHLLFVTLQSLIRGRFQKSFLSKRSFWSSATAMKCRPSSSCDLSCWQN